MADKQQLTTAFGIPVGDNQHSQTAGERGPTLLQDFQLIEKLAHFDRERIPERVVHAKGAGAYGYFEVTHDLTRYTKAKFLNQVGKKTDVFVRFSTVGGERGAADTERDPRGFAIKFYTEEGNYDLTGNNLPVFFIRDAIKFPDFVHTQKRNPQTNLKDHTMFWDFLSRTPEATHMLTMVFSDRGVPASYRHMHGFAVHTFKWVNAQGEAFWVKYHWKTESGIRCLTGEEPHRIAGEDPDFCTRDLFNHIQAGGEAVWVLKAQIIPYEEGLDYRYDIFDPTKVVLYSDYPEIPVGRLVLNRNPQNYFAEVEQAAFSPSNLVPGIEPSPDRLLQGRLFSYPDTQRHRLGANYDQIPVNCPYAARRHTNQRDGLMQVNGNGGASPNYEPNVYSSHTTSTQYVEHADPLSGLAKRNRVFAPEQDFEQAGMLYRIMKPEERDRLIQNLSGHMRGVDPTILKPQIAYFYQADADYGSRLAAALEIPLDDVLAVVPKAMVV
ncbi:MAG: catalase [Candidatus Melainabacteria bacterium]|nr:catalase [Candidatus Melainabacteria bacterium]